MDYLSLIYKFRCTYIDTILKYLNDSTSLFSLNSSAVTHWHSKILRQICIRTQVLWIKPPEQMMVKGTRFILHYISETSQNQTTDQGTNA